MPPWNQVAQDDSLILVVVWATTPVSSTVWNVDYASSDTVHGLQETRSTEEPRGHYKQASR